MLAKLLRAADVLASGHIRRTVHHGGANGDQGAGQWFGLREGQKPGRAPFGPISDGAAEPRARTERIFREVCQGVGPRQSEHS